jgi:ABC-2 type transport system permease protein
VAWVAGLFVGGISYGSIGNDVKDVIGDSQATKDIIAQGTGDVVDLFWVTTALMLSLIATGYALMATLRLRSEETAGRVEPLLATALDRRRWMGEHLVVAFGGSAVVLAAAGAGAGLAYGLAIGDAGQIPRLAAVALTYTPAVWVMVGFAAALFGFVPRAMVVVWGALAVFGFVGLFAQLLDLPHWLIDLSPFQHVPQVPATSFDVVPILVLTLVAGALTAAGLVGFRRRDLTT